MPVSKRRTARSDKLRKGGSTAANHVRSGTPDAPSSQLRCHDENKRSRSQTRDPNVEPSQLNAGKGLGSTLDSTSQTLEPNTKQQCRDLPKQSNDQVGTSQVSLDEGVPSTLQPSLQPKGPDTELRVRDPSTTDNNQIGLSQRSVDEGVASTLAPSPQLIKIPTEPRCHGTPTAKNDAGDVGIVTGTNITKAADITSHSTDIVPIVPVLDHKEILLSILRWGPARRPHGLPRRPVAPSYEENTAHVVPTYTTQRESSARAPITARERCNLEEVPSLRGRTSRPSRTDRQQFTHPTGSQEWRPTVDYFSQADLKYLFRNPFAHGVTRSTLRSALHHNGDLSIFEYLPANAVWYYIGRVDNSRVKDFKGFVDSHYGNGEHANREGHVLTHSPFASDIIRFCNPFTSHIIYTISSTPDTPLTRRFHQYRHQLYKFRGIVMSSPYGSQRGTFPTSYGSSPLNPNRSQSAGVPNRVHSNGNSYQGAHEAYDPAMVGSYPPSAGEMQSRGSPIPSRQRGNGFAASQSFAGNFGADIGHAQPRQDLADREYALQSTRSASTGPALQGGLHNVQSEHMGTQAYPDVQYPQQMPHPWLNQMQMINPMLQGPMMNSMPPGQMMDLQMPPTSPIMDSMAYGPMNVQMPHGQGMNQMLPGQMMDHRMQSPHPIMNQMPDHPMMDQTAPRGMQSHTTMEQITPLGPSSTTTPSPIRGSKTVDGLRQALFLGRFRRLSIATQLTGGEIDSARHVPVWPSSTAGQTLVETDASFTGNPAPTNSSLERVETGESSTSGDIMTSNGSQHAELASSATHGPRSSTGGFKPVPTAAPFHPRGHHSTDYSPTHGSRFTVGEVRLGPTPVSVDPQRVSTNSGSQHVAMANAPNPGPRYTVGGVEPISAPVSVNPQRVSTNGSQHVAMGNAPTPGPGYNTGAKLLPTNVPVGPRIGSMNSGPQHVTTDHSHTHGPPYTPGGVMLASTPASVDTQRISTNNGSQHATMDNSHTHGASYTAGGLISADGVSNSDLQRPQLHESPPTHGPDQPAAGIKPKQVAVTYNSRTHFPANGTRASTAAINPASAEVPYNTSNLISNRRHPTVGRNHPVSTDLSYNTEGMGPAPAGEAMPTALISGQGGPNHFAYARVVSSGLARSHFNSVQFTPENVSDEQLRARYPLVPHTDYDVRHPQLPGTFSRARRSGNPGFGRRPQTEDEYMTELLAFYYSGMADAPRHREVARRGLAVEGRTAETDPEGAAMLRVLIPAIENMQSYHPRDTSGNPAAPQNTSFTPWNPPAQPLVRGDFGGAAWASGSGPWTTFGRSVAAPGAGGRGFGAVGDSRPGASLIDAAPSTLRTPSPEQAGAAVPERTASSARFRPLGPEYGSTAGNRPRLL